LVIDQLTEHAGQQFDHRVVRTLVQSSILEEYAETMRLAREGQTGDGRGEQVPRVPSMSTPARRPATVVVSQYH
jgi:hypothetical protein